MKQERTLPLRRNRRVLVERVGRKLVLFNPAGEEFHELNATASIIWERVENSTIHQIATEIARRTQASIAKVERDVDSLVRQLIDKKLLRVYRSRKRSL